MKKILMAAVLSLLAYSAQATIITFEEFGLVNNSSSNGEVTGNEWLGFGVTFSTGGLALNLGATPASSPNSLGADANSVNDFDGNLTIQFTGALSYSDVSFIIFNTPFSATAFSVGNVALHTINSAGNFTETFDFSGYAVNRIEITGSFYAIDDLSFNNVSVPEPATLALLLMGLLGLGFNRRVKLR